MWQPRLNLQESKLLSDYPVNELLWVGSKVVVIRCLQC